jgi:Tfp pilus assembly protein PilF
LAAPESDDERFARATVGAPRSQADRDAAIPAYERGMAYLGAHKWELAKAQFKEALRLDGSVAAYHAALGEVYFVEEDWPGAAAEYTAALLIDVDNDDYRARLKEARARK